MRWSSAARLRDGAIACAAVAAGFVVAGCTPDAAAPHREPTLDEWEHAGAELARLRAGAPRAPYVANVRVTMREPRSGRTLDARGAVAVDAERGVRMILVGPGGMTALDAWVTRDAFRLAVPALEVVRRGKRDGARGLPVGFFRWWFLAPLQGKLVAAEVLDKETMLLLHDGPAMIELRVGRDASHLSGVRRDDVGGAERIEWYGKALAPAAGDRAAYAQLETGLRVDVVIESAGAEPPDPAAFDDPDREASP